MTAKIGIFSGKGGSGKTTIAVNLSKAFSLIGKKVLLIDGDFHMPNLGTYFGMPFDNSLHDVLKGEKNIHEVIYTHNNLNIIFGSIDLRDREVKTSEFSQYIYQLDGLFDIIIVDSGLDLRNIVPGVSTCFVVTTPDLMSVVDTLKTIRFIEHLGKGVEGVIVNRMKTGSIPLENIVAMLGRPIIGVIPEDDAVHNALHNHATVFDISIDSASAQAYRHLVKGIHIENYREHPLHKIFHFFGLK